MKAFSAQAETAALKTITDGEATLSMKFLSFLSSEHFGYEPAKRIFTRISSLVKLGKPVPTSGVIKTDPALDEESQYLLDGNVEPLKTADDVEVMSGILEQYRKGRIVTRACSNVADNLKGVEDPDLTESLRLMEDALIKCRSNSEKPMYHSGTADNSGGIVSDLLNEETLDLIPTGFKAFDEKSGGFSRGDLVIIAANRGGGKSAMALQLMLNWYKQGKSVCFITYEMSEQQLYGRIYSNWTDIEHNVFRLKKFTMHDRVTIENARKEIQEHGEKHNCRFTISYPARKMTVDELGMLLKPFGYDIIIVDYINLLDDSIADQGWEVLIKHSRAAKLVAGNLNCVFLMLAQIGEDGRTKYSKGIEDNADFVWYWIYDDAAKQTRTLAIKQSKARNAEMFDFNLKALYNKFQIKDSDGEPVQSSKKEWKGGESSGHLMKPEKMNDILGIGEDADAP